MLPVSHGLSVVGSYMLHHKSIGCTVSDHGKKETRDSCSTVASYRHGEKQDSEKAS